MLLKKSMALLGIGSARIDLILPKDTYYCGENINGYFSIHGGTVEQKIKRIDCDLIMIDQSRGIEEVIDSVTILSSRLMLSGESDKIAFTFKVPNFVQISTEEKSYYFKTRLTFNEGMDSRDHDNIQIIE